MVVKWLEVQRQDQRRMSGNLLQSGRAETHDQWRSLEQTDSQWPYRRPRETENASPKARFDPQSIDCFQIAISSLLGSR
jgi:hypothetical protein